MADITSTLRRHGDGRAYDRCGNRESTFLNPQNFAITIGKPMRPFGIWGVITELPIGATVRLVGEVNGESVHGKAANNSGLLGLLWQSPVSNVVVDAGIRRG